MEQSLQTPLAPAEAHESESRDGAYIGVYAFLVVLTLIEVIVSYASTIAIVKALLLLILASGKATLVAGWYMHLRYEKRFMPLVFLGPIIVGVLAILAIQQLLLR